MYYLWSKIFEPWLVLQHVLWENVPWRLAPCRVPQYISGSPYNFPDFSRFLKFKAYCVGESINISQTRINFRKIIFGKGIFNELTRSSPSTFYLFFSIKAWISLSLIRAPTNLSCSKILLILRRFLIIFKPWPFFKNTTVGIALIPNSIAISSNSSTSILSKSVSGSFLTTLTENFCFRQLLKNSSKSCQIFVYL